LAQDIEAGNTFPDLSSRNGVAIYKLQ